MASATSGFDFCLNGRRAVVNGRTVQTSLLDYVRSAGLTGAKEGCAEGECGACAVLLVSGSVHGTSYRAVNSCLVPLPAIAGQEVYTVEALAESGRLAAVQEAMASGGGSQCGYCTPGFVVSMFAEQHRRDGKPADIHGLTGNLCRCTGYRPIRDALVAAGPPRDSALRRRLDAAAPGFRPVTHESGQRVFSRPCTLAGCMELQAGHPAARLVAGNTDLGVLTNLRDERFPHLISLEGVADLREFRDEADFVEIGAGLTLTEIEELWAGAPAVFHEWIELFASPLIRNRATLGGNLATASPIGDSAPLLLAFDAEVRIAGLAGERMVPLAEFFTGYRGTVLGPGEILRSVRIPKPFPADARFFKMAKRRMDDISTVAAGIATRGSGLVIGFGGVAAVPVRVEARDMDDAMAKVARFEPISDHRGSAEYRKAMAASLIRRFVGERTA